MTKGMKNENFKLLCKSQTTKKYMISFLFVNERVSVIFLFILIKLLVNIWVGKIIYWMT